MRYLGLEEEKVAYVFTLCRLEDDRGGRVPGEGEVEGERTRSKLLQEPLLEPVTGKTVENSEALFL